MATVKNPAPPRALKPEEAEILAEIAHAEGVIHEAQKRVDDVQAEFRAKSKLMHLRIEILTQRLRVAGMGQSERDALRLALNSVGSSADVRGT